MFLGYQNDKIAFVAETREELENLPCVILDKIEETDKEYFLHNGEYITELPTPTYEEVRQIREALYREQKDPITCQIQSLRDEEQTPEIIAEIDALIIKRAEIVAKIKQENPYPEQKSIKIEENIEKDTETIKQKSTIL